MLWLQSKVRVRRCLALLTLLAAACEARQVTPVPLSQPGDTALTCEQIAAEIAGNEAEAIRLVGADSDVTTDNALLAVTGTVLFWPALFALDVSSAEQIQFRALRDRNTNLARLQQDRGC